MTTQKKTVSRKELVIFTNWTDKDFNGVWDKKVYPLKAKKSYEVSFYLAEHFAKHLADREWNRTFNSELQKMKEKVGHRIDRRELEHRVQNSKAVSKMSRQEMLDKCMDRIPGEEERVEVVKPKEIKLREVVLRKDERGEELKEKYPGIEVQVNQKALDQRDKPDEEFEEEAK